MSSAPASPRRFLPLRALRAAFRPAALLAAGLASVGVFSLAAQNPGERDTNFTSAAIGFNVYTQFIEQVAGVPYIFVGGNFGGIDLLVASDGEVNQTTESLFTFPEFGTLGGRIIYTAVPEITPPAVDGYEPNILVGGQFGRNAIQVKAKQAAQNVLRISSRGVIDTTFNAGGRGANGFVTSITPLADGGSLVAGEFDAYNGQNHPHIVRLNNQGVPESSSVFDPSLRFDATILSVAAERNLSVAADQQIALEQFVVAGQFSNVNGATHNKLARINYDGSLDSSFNPSFDDRTTVVVTQPDGKILVGGDFENVNGVAAKHIVRLNYDGSVDQSFTASVTGQPFGFIDPPAVYVIKLLNDGRMYLGGNFTTVNGTVRNYLARVNADGSLDAAFDPGKGIINAVQSVTIQPDGKLLVGETLSKKNGNNVQPPSLIRLYAEPTNVAVNALQGSINISAKSTQDVFRVSRDNAALDAGPIYVQFGGTAKLNHDYKLPQGVTRVNDSGLYSLNIPPGESTANIGIKPKGKVSDSKHLRPGGTVTLTVSVVEDSSGIAAQVYGGSATLTIINQ